MSAMGLAAAMLISTMATSAGAATEQDEQTYSESVVESLTEGTTEPEATSDSDSDETTDAEDAAEEVIEQPPAEEPGTNSDVQQEADATESGTITVSGTLLVIPSELAPVIEIEAEGAPEPEVAYVGSVSLLPESGGEPIQLFEGDTDKYTTGQQAEATILVPAPVRESVEEELDEDFDTLVELQSSQAEIVNEQQLLKLVVDAAEEIRAPLEVIELEGGEELQVSAAAVSHQVDVIFLEAPGVTAPAQSTISALVTRLSDYWRSETNGQLTGITAPVIQRQTMPSSYCDRPVGALWNWAAEQFGNTPFSYTGVSPRHLMVLESSAACGLGSGVGVATVGSSVNSGGLSWSVVDSATPQQWNGVVFHEFGHNLSLHHSNALHCSAGTYDIASFTPQGASPDTRCVVNEYADIVDVMGSGHSSRVGSQVSSNSEHVAALSVTHRMTLGAIAEHSIRRVTPTGGATQTVDLLPLTNNSGIRAIEITAPGSGKYLLEYRAGTGRDANALYSTWQGVVGNSKFGRGVRVLRQPAPAQSAVLHRPSISGEASGVYPYLKQGAKFTAHNNGFAVTVTAMNTTKATVQITYAPYVLPAAKQLAGADRFETAVKVSRELLVSPAANTATAIIATGLDYPDSLSAASLGAKLNAPLLLSYVNSIPKTTSDELKRIRPKNLIIVGGTGVVNSKVETDLRNLVKSWGGTVERRAGANRYTTSVSIAKRGWSKSDVVFIATGTGFADALSAGAAAGAVNAPVILVPGDTSTLPTDVRDYIRNLGATKAYIAGGTGAVSANMEKSIKAALSAKQEVKRYAGTNRYHTSALIGQDFNTVGGNSYLANGDGFADALAGAVLAGTKQAPLLLSTRNCVPAEVANLNTNTVKPSSVYLLGGSGVLNPSTVGKGTRC